MTCTKYLKLRGYIIFFDHDKANKSHAFFDAFL